MKKTCLLIALAVVALASCTKNNTTTNTTVIAPLPAFTVNGIHDVSFTNGLGYYPIEMPITVQYSDSAQENVSLSLSPLPAGITMDTTWITSGIPTFTTTLTLADTTVAGATPGTYPMTLTVTGTTSGTKTYKFNIKVIAQPSCITPFLLAYTHCSSSCSMSGLYSDNVTSDPTVVNKMWFNNVNNTGLKIYGIYSCTTEHITIPTQVVNGVSYFGSGSVFSSVSGPEIQLSLQNNSTSSFCSITMY